MKNLIFTVLFLNLLVGCKAQTEKQDNRSQLEEELGVPAGLPMEVLEQEREITNLNLLPRFTPIRVRGTVSRINGRDPYWVRLKPVTAPDEPNSLSRDYVYAVICLQTCGDRNTPGLSYQDLLTAKEQNQEIEVSGKNFTSGWYLKYPGTASSVIENNLLITQLEKQLLGLAEEYYDRLRGFDKVPFESIVPLTTGATWQNQFLSGDVNNDFCVSPVDGVELLSALGTRAGILPASKGSNDLFLDVDGDGTLGITDVTALILDITNDGIRCVLPAKPQGVAVVSTKTSITVAWEEGSINTVGFQVAHVAGNEAPATCEDGDLVFEGRNFTLTDVELGQEFSFRVCALGNNGTRSAGVAVAGTVENSNPYPWQRPGNSLDVNGDDCVSPIDALTVINYINSHGTKELDLTKPATSPFVDTNGDNKISPVDVLKIVNYINNNGASCL